MAWPTLIPIISIGAWLISPWALTEVHPSLPAVFVVLWITAVVLGWRLHRTRVVYAAFSLGLLYQGYSVWGTEEILPALQMGSSLFFALVMVIFGFAGDRGLTTPAGVFRLIVLLAASCLTAWVCLPAQTALVQSLYGPLIPVPALNGLVIPQLTLFISVVAGISLAIRFADKRGAIDSAMIGALIAGECAIWNGFGTPNAMIWLVGGQLILVLGLMEGFHSMAYKDELTGLAGRRAMNQLMNQLSGHYAICMVDIDHFKKFNDRYGHDAGDEVLRMVAGQLGLVGLGGKVFRYGGEEFTVIFAGKTAERVEEELDELRESISKRPFVFRGMGRPRKKPEEPKPIRRPRKTTQITVSMGLADSKGGQKDADRVLKEADQNLYRAKDAGRNTLIW